MREKVVLIAYMHGYANQCKKNSLTETIKDDNQQLTDETEIKKIVCCG